MKKHLTNLTNEDVINLIGKVEYDEIITWPTIDVSRMYKDDWIDILLSVRGLEVFKNSRMREILATTLTDAEYNKMRTVFNNQKLTIDNIINKIKRLQWKRNDELIAFIKLFKLDNMYLDETIIDEYEEVEDLEFINRTNRLYELLDYQFVIKQNVLNRLRKNTPLQRMIIQMPTGTGKTKTAMHICNEFFLNDMEQEGIILWLAHTNILLEQAISTLKNVWSGIGSGRIGVNRLYERHNLDIDINLNGFVFCGFQKLIGISNNQPELYEYLLKNVRLIIVDEAHRAPAKEIKKAIEGLMRYVENDRSLVGLTATAGRSDVDVNENEKLLNMFDHKKFTIDIETLNQINKTKTELFQTDKDEGVIKYLQERKVLATLKREVLSYQNKLNKSELDALVNCMRMKKKTKDGDFSNDFINLLATNRSRNSTIFKRLIELDKNKIPTIVFACNKMHAKILAAMLNYKEVKNVVVTGDMSQYEKDVAIKEFKEKDNNTNIIINYEVLTTGFDSTNIKCVFITRPTHSIVTYSQMLGRGLRGKMMGGNEKCLLIDVDDNLKRYTNEADAFEYFENYWD